MRQADAISDLTSRIGGGLIDSHVHLFPPKLQSAIAKWFDQHTDWTFPYLQYPAEDILKQLEQSGISEAFVLLYCHKPDMSLELNRWLHQLIKRQPTSIRIHPFGAVHPQDSHLSGVIETTLDRWQFAGLKLQCSVMQIRPDDPGLIPIMEALVQRDKWLVIHAGTAPEHDGYGGFDAFARLMERHPDLRVIVPHLGLGEFEAFTGLLDRYPQLHLDTAAVLGNTRPELQVERSALDTLMQRHPDRILFGTDIPVCEQTVTDVLRTVHSYDWPDSWYERLLRQNALSLVDPL